MYASKNQIGRCNCTHCSCSKMEGDNIVHMVDTVLMPSGYDMYEGYYQSVTATSTMEKLLEMTGISTYPLFSSCVLHA